jgi:hypothetical protein
MDLQNGTDLLHFEQFSLCALISRIKIQYFSSVGHVPPRPNVPSLRKVRKVPNWDFKMFEASCLVFSTSPETLEPTEDEEVTK